MRTQGERTHQAHLIDHLNAQKYQLKGMNRALAQLNLSDQEPNPVSKPKNRSESLKAASPCLKEMQQS